jgi:AraC-like DNA-binding protein
MVEVPPFEGDVGDAADGDGEAAAAAPAASAAINVDVSKLRIMPANMSVAGARRLDKFIDPRAIRRALLRDVQMTSFAPDPRLAPFVRAFLIVETHDEATRLLIPEPGLVLGFRYRGSASIVDGEAATRVADATLTGVVPRARRMRTAAGGGVILAAFHPAGAAQFFAEPLHHLFGATVALDALVPRRAIDRIATRVAEAADHAQRIAILERALLSWLRPAPPDPVVASAVRAIQAARGAIRIRALAGALAISQDPLEKRFRRAVGTSPKQLASLLRVRHAIGAHRPGVSLSRLSHDAGYFDHSHFIRDLRAVTGLPPGRFFRSGDVC